jgi:hypothetical protein
MASYSTTSGSTWQPGVVYLLSLLAVEIIIMGVLRTMTKHGG